MNSETAISNNKSRSKPKPKPKQQPKLPAKPVVVDPDPNHFPSLHAMSLVHARYSDSTRTDGGSSLPPAPRPGEQQSEERKRRAEAIAHGNIESAARSEEEEIRQKIMVSSINRWTLHCLRINQHAKVNYGDNVDDVQILPDPNRSTN